MDLEDYVSVGAAPDAVEQPRKLSRLRKGGTKPYLSAAAPKENEEPNHGVQHDEEFEAQQQAPVPPPDSEEHAAGDAAAEDVEPSADGKEESYYDEEDELEDYFGKRLAAGGGEGASASEGEEDEKASARRRGVHAGGTGALLGGGSDSDSENDEDWRPEDGVEGEDGGADVGGTAEEVAAETQRVLRETAARDRLGQGHHIEIKPLSSILDKLKQRQALAIARAPKPALNDVGSFDDILAEAAAKAGPAPSAGAPAAVPAEASAGVAEGAARGAGAPEAGCSSTPTPSQAGDGGEGEADLEILSSDDELEQGVGEMRLVELPSTAKKKRFASYPSQEVEFEDEVLIDDGYRSSDEEEAEGGRGQRESSASLAASEEASSDAEGSSAGEEDDEEEEEGASQPAGLEQAAAANGAAEVAEEGGSPAGGASGGGDQEMAEASEKAPGSAAASGSPGSAAAAVPDLSPGFAKAAKKERRMQRMLLDMEAELSEEEEGQGSEDEEEDDLDDKGELADLIDSKAKMSGKDRLLGEALHREWAERQDQAELQKVLRGLKNGFRRRRGAGGFLDEEEEDAAARRRRARLEEEDPSGGDGGLPWPSPYDMLAGSDEEGDEAALLKQANQRHLVDSQGLDDVPSCVPLDEGSHEVLDLLARSSSSEPQLAGLAEGPGRSRFAPPLAGSDPSNSRSAVGVVALARGGLSFVGRQPTVQRAGSSAAMGASGRSFVFGRSEQSNSALPDSQQEEPAAGPTNFANLRQLTKLPSKKAGGSRRGGPSLVSRLVAPSHRPAGKEPVGDSSRQFDAAQAVAEHVLLAGRAAR